MKSLTPLERRLKVMWLEGRLWLGRAGTLGLGLLVIALCMTLWIPRIAADTASTHARSEAERDRLRDGIRVEEIDPDTQLRDFRDGFPESAQLLADVRLIFKLAREQQVQLARGDYASTRKAEAGLTTCDVVLPVKTSYPALRAFIASVLNTLPNASLAELRVERGTGNQGNQLSARVHLTLYYRET